MYITAAYAQVNLGENTYCYNKCIVFMCELYFILFWD